MSIRKSWTHVGQRAPLSMWRIDWEPAVAPRVGQPSDGPTEGPGPHRVCNGITFTGHRCDTKTAPRPTSDPTFCRKHEKQQQYLKFSQCVASIGAHRRCPELVPLLPDGSSARRLSLARCASHEKQALRKKICLPPAPLEIWRMIITELKPVDRVAFALANTECRNLVKGWATETPKHPELTRLAKFQYRGQQSSGSWSFPGEREKSHIRALRCAAFLFQNGNNEHRCMGCEAPLNGADRRAWGFWKRLSAPRDWQCEQLFPTAQTLLCRKCERCMDFQCGAATTETDIARAYWKVQLPMPTEVGESSSKKRKRD